VASELTEECTLTACQGVTLGQGDPVALESLRPGPVVGVVLGAHPPFGGRPVDLEVEDVPVVYPRSVGSHVVLALTNLRTRRSAVSPVSSDASRIAAASGDSPGWMLPAGT
jgi:hypothetical protein